MSRLAIQDDPRYNMCSKINVQQDGEKAIRMRMVRRLQHRLDAVQQSSGQDTPSSKISTNQAARTLEKLLWRNSCNDLYEYQNLETLQERLRRILAVQVCRRTLKRKNVKTNSNPNANTNTNRKEALIQVLGSLQAYQEALSLCNTIRTAKLQKVATMKSCGSSGNATCPYSPVKNEFPADAPFPPPVGDLFFHTALPQAMVRTPVHRLELLDWPKMIKQARQHLQAFQDYNEKQRQHL
ncbi:MAG: hypothetical protein SGILL_008753 [Bacillariaceae sp.]